MVVGKLFQERPRLQDEGGQDHTREVHAWPHLLAGATSERKTGQEMVSSRYLLDQEPDYGLVFVRYLLSLVFGSTKNLGEEENKQWRCRLLKNATYKYNL